MKRLLSLFLLCAVSTALPMQNAPMQVEWIDYSKNAVIPQSTIETVSTNMQNIDFPDFNAIPTEQLASFCSTGLNSIKSFILDRPLEAFVLGVALTIISAKANDFYEKYHEVQTQHGKKISTASNAVRVLFATGMSLGLLFSIVTFLCTKS